ncbi:hypothetical protein [Modestobacter sp. I12A-02662]|uniref:hypothetical protein n=1 Tax=Modestobacter sp. I12A-02662 TaxID=1730496 RepID=UPI0034DF91C2
MTPPLGSGAAVLLLALACTGCTSVAEPAEPAVRSAATAALPTDAGELEELLLDEVPSGLPRVADDELDPPAGEKSADDVAAYAEDDAAHQEEVLGQYGYLRGWERFWRGDDALTTVFLDQFDDPGGAATYAEDLARNDAEHYGGQLDRSPAGLPADCVLMTVEQPDPAHGMAGPAVFSWCGRGVFTVSVAAVRPGMEDARAEVAAVVAEQLERLPPT